ncbi:procyclic acidic repetitive family protein [Streptomyces beihaiensis]|uniref:Procyclic acidic repetitive family protein n=1 Tax=Streptomyces beihaiensis TaxID=2984495 RepID=A0ABT3TRJ3_9ACTN|nr:procyclic acidic repetitive family protein [Streptomyces beihaiensis]MCX3059663.1 procyclic acidic repetitive family protein [Streptomyces beihaiensis]
MAQAAPAEPAAPATSPGPAAPATSPLSWDTFAERAMAEGVDEAVSPQAELVGVLQRRHDDLGAARGEAAQAAAGAREALFEVASLVGRFEQLIGECQEVMADSGQARLHRRLRILKDQMLQVLKDDGVEIRDPVGLPADEVADWTDPIGWRYGAQFATESVARTDEPAVFHHGAVVRLARVFMGSPEPQSEPQSGPQSEPRPGPQSEPQPEPQSEPHHEPRPEPQSGPQTPPSQAPGETDNDA